MKRQVFFILVFFTLFGFTTIATLIVRHISGVAFLSIFSLKYLWYKQLIIGVVYGLISVLILNFIIKKRFMANVRTIYERFIKELNLRTYEIVYVSISAGIGEEILFRGAIQPLLGIWLTAFIFVLLHGYLNPRNWRISVYGAVMWIIVAGFGYLCKYIGLISAISAHFIIDLILLLKLKYQSRK